MIAWIRRLLTASRACGALAPSSPATRCVGSLSRGAALLAARPAEAQPTRGTVLIADDDLDLAIAVSMRLERLGLCVRRSSDSLHALLGAQLVDFDLVIMDVQMPSGNGLAVCEMMADIPSLANVPVIVFTGRTDAETKKRCRELGAHYVAKTGQSMQVLVELTCRILHIPPPLEAPAGPSLDANADSTGDGGDQNSPGGRTSTSMGRVPCAAAARREFRSRVEQLARDENKAVAEIRIRRMRSDWSSCSPRGRITFNAALLQMSVEFQNQVIAQTLDGLPNATGAERTETGGAIVPFESFASMNGAASAATSNVPATIKLLDVMAAPSHATPPAPADADANANNGAPPPPKRPRLLCIDDDPAIANALTSCGPLRG